ncbi:MAG TPA: hypothetical protein VN625_03195 [Desulfuromonadaceae bacterium]|nr:hypothetical protein [Desulfuromonadaceae bacterium]
MNEIPIHRLQRYAFAAGILGCCLGALGCAWHPRDFFVSYLFSYLFWIGLSLGCFQAALIHYLTGGRWGAVGLRMFEAGYMTLPLMAVLFVPLLFGLRDLYPWAQSAALAANKVLQQRAAYENVTGFVLRAVFVFAVWIVIAVRLRKWSLQQDNTDDIAPTLKLRSLSGPAMVLVPLTATFAFVDWIMSTEAAWFSTIFGVILLADELLLAFAAVILLLALFQRHAPFSRVVTPKEYHDLGNLLLTFVLFWTYVAFSQFLIVYAGDQPREIEWYLHRVEGGWRWLIGIIAVFHFFVPFFLLLFRSVKQRVRRLVLIAALIVMAQVLATFWVVVPTFYPLQFHWMDAAAWIGVGGIWVGVFAANLKRHPLLAKNNPLVQTALTKTVDAK